jgi:hypothetical protein
MDVRTLIEEYDKVQSVATDLAELAEANGARDDLDKNLIALLHSHARKRLEHMRQDISLLRATVRQ